ncbi:hypothetical protein PGB90_004144 [Kerria lacca]
MLSHCNLLSDSNNGDISLSPNSFISYKDELEPSSRPHSPILTQVDIIINNFSDIVKSCLSNILCIRI